MKARIWGCRGSLATPGAATVRYGGNTTCLEVRSESGSVVVLDAGTGIRELGIALARESLHHIDLLLTHLHLDHIEGLGFFALLFDPESTIRIHGPRPANGTLKEKIAAYLSPPYFPVPFEQIDARISFEEIETDTWNLNGLRISSAPVCHPGATLAYRLEEHERIARLRARQRAGARGPSPAWRSPVAPTSCCTTPSTPTRNTRRASVGATRP